MGEPFDENPDALKRLNDPSPPSSPAEVAGELAIGGLGELVFLNPITGVLGVFALIAAFVFATRDRR